MHIQVSIVTFTSPVVKKDYLQDGSELLEGYLLLLYLTAVR
jgi:hypothetical protein